MRLDDDQILQLLRSVDPARNETSDPPPFAVVRARIAAHRESPARRFLHRLSTPKLGIFVLGAVLLGGSAGALAATGVIRIGAPAPRLLAVKQHHAQVTVESHKPLVIHTTVSPKSARPRHHQAPMIVHQRRPARAKSSKVTTSVDRPSRPRRTDIREKDHRRSHAPNLRPATIAPPRSSPSPSIAPAVTTGTTGTAIGETTTGARATMGTTTTTGTGITGTTATSTTGTATSVVTTTTGAVGGTTTPIPTTPVAAGTATLRVRVISHEGQYENPTVEVLLINAPRGTSSGAGRGGPVAICPKALCEVTQTFVGRVPGEWEVSAFSPAEGATGNATRSSALASTTVALAEHQELEVTLEIPN